MTVNLKDIEFMEKAIDLALKTEVNGNLPIGAIIVLDNEIIAKGSNTLLVPYYNPKCHAEMNALDNVEPTLWKRSNEMTCYTTLEPCCMCFGRLLLSGIGRIVFGALDTEGGSGCLLNHLPRFYNQTNVPIWVGPIMPEKCDDLFNRSLRKFKTLGKDS